VSCGIDGSYCYCISVYVIYHSKTIEQCLLSLLQNLAHMHSFVRMQLDLQLRCEMWDDRLNPWGKMTERLLLLQYVILQHISPQVWVETTCGRFQHVNSEDVNFCLWFIIQDGFMYQAKSVLIGIIVSGARKTCLLFMHDNTCSLAGWNLFCWQYKWRWKWWCRC